MMVHTTGPSEKANEAMKVTRKMRVTVPVNELPPPCPEPWPSTSNMAPTTIRLTPIPTEPTRSRGRRPKRSTQATATNVATTLTAPMAHRVARLWLAGVANPAAAKILSA